jgi:hypothetical protein
MKSGFLCLLVLLIASPIFAQPGKGDFEIGFSGSGGSIKREATYSFNQNASSGAHFGKDTQSTTYVNLFIRRLIISQKVFQSNRRS